MSGSDESTFPVTEIFDPFLPRFIVFAMSVFYMVIYK